MFRRTKGAIAGGDELTVEAGYEILKAGGNAFDAAISATLMTFVASSTITSIGGGGFMIASQKDKKPVLLDFFTHTPISKRPKSETEFFPVIVDFGDKTQEFHVGMGTAATPGNLAGLFEIHKWFGSIPFEELVVPACVAAKNGVKLHKQTKYQADILKPILILSENGKQIYTVNGEVRNLGERYRLTRFSDFLEYVAREGPREFYEGEIAQKISTDSKEKGGHLVYNDFKNYQVIEREPLKFPYRDFSILTNAPPNSGGPLIAFTISILNQYPLKKDQWGTDYHLNLLAHAIEYTTLARKDIFIRNRYHKYVMDLLLEKNFLIKIKAEIDKSLRKSGNTTHVSVVDDLDNFVAITTSHGEGCGYFIPGTDIMLNNMLGEEDLCPEGFFNWLSNERISSMMSPTLFQKDNQTVGVLGSGGSNRIRSAIVQAISNYVDFGMPPYNCVNAPRIHWESNHLDVEPGYDRDIVDRLELPGDSAKIYWTDKNMYFGGVHAVFKDNKGNLEAAGDKRRVGAIRKIE
jgi:gamma-glutamyltranspeptidase/glutathione hydrolase